MDYDEFDYTDYYSDESYYEDPTPDYDVFERRQLDLDADVEREDAILQDSSASSTLEGLRDDAAQVLARECLDEDDEKAQRHYSMQYIAACQALALERIASILEYKFG